MKKALSFFCAVILLFNCTGCQGSGKALTLSAEIIENYRLTDQEVNTLNAMSEDFRDAYNTYQKDKDAKAFCLRILEILENRDPDFTLQNLSTRAKPLDIPADASDTERDAIINSNSVILNFNMTWSLAWLGMTSLEIQVARYQLGEVDRIEWEDSASSIADDLDQDYFPLLYGISLSE